MIVLAVLTRNTLSPLLLTYENESSYLHIDSQGCALFIANSYEPSYRIQEPLLLAHGIMTDSKTVHLVVLKSSGDLCYTLISGAGTPQTTLIAKLDVRGTRYRRLFLFPQGKVIHIFYASTHKSIPELWRIEHRFWNGNTWHSTHMGEVVHPREPLYHVNLDSQGNLHLCSVTFQGRYSLLFTNRFNGTFHIWGSPTETLKIAGEVMDMAALMTTDNVHHLFWVVKTPTGQFELRSAQQLDAHELSSIWHPSLAPIKTFNSPCKNIGALEIGGVLWLLVYTGEEILMQNDGKGWKLLSTHTPSKQNLQWVHKDRKYFHQTYWLEDQIMRHAPAYYLELGFNVNIQTPPPSPSYPVPNQVRSPISTPTPTPAPPPVPAFYPDQLSSNCDPLPNIPATINIREVNSPNPPVISPEPVVKMPDTPGAATEIPKISEVHETVATPEVIEILETPQTPEALVPENLTEEVLHPMPSKESDQLQSLIKTVAHLEQENNLLSLAVKNMLSKFDQVIEVISENALQAKQEDPPPFDELEPVKEAMSNLEKETQSLSQVMRVMLVKQEERDSSLEKLETQISQLQSEKDDLKTKGGFWNKWIT
ncbi:hypothetical protein [Desulfosporosinus nitroreducens]|uniref:Uncharacterized protein n=1 Tax=Desulfosporosinus nitroreducens TaxID=2018668 RepID=A0ABT8QSF5_9FIRM|nr:hypothetical protein [Desulfosporosinus nitroreducens]MDO0823529.1 hypothetical protein [Desulfosporosinus nitroreducens]